MGGQQEGGPGGGPGHEGHCCGGHAHGGSGDDHVEQTTQMFQQAFWQAYRELSVEALKSKMKKAWAPRIDKIADAVVRSMEDEWKAFHRHEKAPEGVRDTIRKIFEKA